MSGSVPCLGGRKTGLALLAKSILQNSMFPQDILTKVALDLLRVRIPFRTGLVKSRRVRLYCIFSYHIRWRFLVAPIVPPVIVQR